MRIIYFRITTYRRICIEEAKKTPWGRPAASDYNKINYIPSPSARGHCSEKSSRTRYNNTCWIMHSKHSGIHSIPSRVHTTYCCAISYTPTHLFVDRVLEITGQVAVKFYYNINIFHNHSFGFILTSWVMVLTFRKTNTFQSQNMQLFPKHQHEIVGRRWIRERWL